MNINDNYAYMLPKENAVQLLARKSEFTYHVIPDRSNVYCSYMYAAISF